MLESETYSVTVTAAEGATAEGITVKLGDYTADTDGNGVDTIRTPKGEAEKYDVIISAQDFQTTDGLKKFYYKAATVTAEEPSVTVVLPTYLASTTLPPSTNTATAAISQDGLYFFDSSKTNVAFIQFINDTDVTKKYTITILDPNSEYVVDNSGDEAEYGNDPFYLYIMGI